jgi:hypothetical protein
MKFVVRSFSIFAVCLVALSTYGRGLDISQTLVLDRYTLIDGDTFEHDAGFLYLDGTFHIITSDIEYYSFYGLTPDFFAPVSGKPLMDETLYNSYHNLGLTPKWIASSFDITIGYETFVIVGVTGKNDVGATVTIVTQPQSQQVIAGWGATFSIEAEPSQYIPYNSYQWYLNSKPIKGQIYSVLIFPTTTSKNTGVYKVAVSSGGTPVMSQGALLQVVTPVTIKKQPAPVTAKTGKKATFKVIALGTGPLHYQWYSGSNAIQNATNSSYAIASAQASDAGQYSVKVQNSLTWNVSNFATLTVTP